MSVKECFDMFRFSAKATFFVALCLSSISGVSLRAQQVATGPDTLVRHLETHAANKQKVLDLLSKLPKLKTIKYFAMDFRGAWRGTIIDGEYEGVNKLAFLEKAIEKCRNEDAPLAQSLRVLLKSHRDLFGSGQNEDVVIRLAEDPTFRPFGVHMDLPRAIAQITEGNDAEVQAFKTIFETGQNTRGYVHKLECHAEAVEFIYAVTDIIYGVMLPGDLKFGPDRVLADPAKVRLFLVRAGEVIALHPYVLHSGSLSVEPDGSFSVIIYKKPVTDKKELAVKLPDAWAKWQKALKIENVDKWFLTLADLHTAELETNLGHVADKRPFRLPVWRQ